jgi:hypothetical protein
MGQMALMSLVTAWRPYVSHLLPMCYEYTEIRVNFLYQNVYFIFWNSFVYTENNEITVYKNLCY